jgi:LysM repeat protein
VVLKGESFYTIAKKYNTTMRAVASANPGVDANRLKIGQKLVVPPPQPAAAMLMADAGPAATNGERVHTVKAGDNLTTIARRHGVSIKDIQSVNNLRTTQIRVGQKLRLPEKFNNASAPTLDAIPPLTPASSTTAGSTAAPVLPQ